MGAMAVKIMLVGDSLTVGAYTRGGFRRMLAAMFPSIEFVGSQRTEYDPATKKWVQGDLRHEGHGGVQPKFFWLNEGFRKSLAANRPDYVFLLIGTNDFARGEDSEEDKEDQRLAEIAVQNQASSPGTTWVVESLPFTGDAAINQRIALLNTSLREKLQAGEGEWGKVPKHRRLFADTAAELNDRIWYRGSQRTQWADVLEASDGTHLTTLGNQILAVGLARVIKALTGIDPKSVGTPPTTHPTTTPSALAGPLLYAADRGRTLIHDTIGGTRPWDSGGLRLLTFDAAVAEKLRTHVIVPYRDLVAKYAAASKVHPAWIHGVVWAESRGNPRALLPGKKADGTPDPAANGVGLMQLTAESLKAGHSDEELYDPELNIRLGTKFLGYLAEKQPAEKRLLPRIASMYNAGALYVDGVPSPHPSEKDALWRMRNHPGYITTVVTAANTAAGLLEGVTPAGKRSAGSNTLLWVAGAVAVVAVPWTLSRRRS